MADESLTEAVKSKDERQILEAALEFVAHELEDNRCPKCRSSQLRTGDTAALVVQLRQITKALQDIPVGGEAEVTWLDEIRARRDEEDEEPVEHGTKNAPRRQGGRSARHKEVSP